MKKYLIIILFILFFCFISGVLAADNASIDTNNIWKNVKGFFTNIWDKMINIWNNNVKPYIDKLWVKFKAFFDRNRIEEELKKETSEMKYNLAEAGKYALGKINNIFSKK